MIRVWDMPTRLFHWGLVALLGFSWWSAEAHEMEWHQWSGLLLCALVIFRIIWGFIGGSTARFTRFLRGPRAVINYLSGREAWRGTGHNPLGGWSVIILLFLLENQIVTGLFAVDVDGIESGPLSWLVDFDQGRVSSGIHHLNFNVLLALAAIHVLAILSYLLVKRRNLIKPMVTGRTTEPEADPVHPLAPAPLWRLGASLLASGLFTYAVARGFQF